MNEGTRTLLLMCGGLLVPAILVVTQLSEAEKALVAAPSAAEGVAVAAASDDDYCTPALKHVLRRVAGACGLLKGAGRGCKPGDVRSVTTLAGKDFNALFNPLAHRARILQFGRDEVELDEGGKSLAEKTWSDQRGASFFFVVARASRDGDPVYNQQLSQKRARSVLEHLQVRFEDPELESQVGLLWLGEEYAQLGKEYCDWTRSHSSDECTMKDINRSAFIAWIDCAI